MTHMLGAVAPLAVLLEGGYNLRATAAGCEAVLRVLLGQKVPAFSRPAVPCTAGLMAIQQVIKQQVRLYAASKDALVQRADRALGMCDGCGGLRSGGDCACSTDMTCVWHGLMAGPASVAWGMRMLQGPCYFCH